MKKIKEFLRDYRETGEAETEISFSIWHIIIVVFLIGFAIYVFS